MSLASTYARCRDGALYKNPILVFPEGFICFDDLEPPELVLWMPKGSAKVPPIEYAIETLERVLGGMGFDRETVRRNKLCQRVRPGTNPEVFTDAHSYLFTIAGRIPRPIFHDGTERHASRVRKCCVYDWPATALDASHIEIPEKV